MKIRRKKYKYMLCFYFSKMNNESKYPETGTGRYFLELDRKIKTQEDVFEVENIIKNTFDKENITQLTLYSFNLLK